MNPNNKNNYINSHTLTSKYSDISQEQEQEDENIFDINEIEEN